MRAEPIYQRRHVLGQGAFVEMVVWRVPVPLDGSTHRFKYRLAYVINGVCVLRYDNEAGKGDHKHVGSVELKYSFANPEALMADFWADVTRWNDENRDS